MRMTASQVLMECLLEQGVDTVFGYPGGTILNIYDEFELHGYEQEDHATSSPPTSRALPTPPTAMPAPPARWACASPPPAPAPPT